MKRILVAVGDFDEAHALVDRAIEAVGPDAGKIRLLHAIERPPLLPMPGVVLPPAGYIQELVGASEASLQKLLLFVPEPLRDGWSLELGSPASAVCRVARAFDVDLVVIGAHEHGALRRALGTTAARIVDRLDRPALVVRKVARASTAAA